MKKLKVGFLIDETDVSYYISDLIRHVEDSDLFESPTLITGYKKNSPRSFGEKLISIVDPNPFKIADSILKIILGKIIWKVEYGFAVKLFPNYGKTIKINHGTEYHQISVDGEWSKSRLYLSFTKADLQKISSSELDCIIRCGSGILKGEILNIASFGVLSFHHGDNRVNRGGPSGFWEVLNDVPSSGFIIQKLNNELDGGEVLFRGNVMTRGFWLANNAQLLEKSNHFFKRFLDEVAKQKRLPQPEGVRLHGTGLFRITSFYTFLKYIMTILLPKLDRKLRNKLFGPSVTRWSVAFAVHNNFSKSLWRYKEIRNPKGRFLADPFVFGKDNVDYIFVEDLFYRDDKGRISVVRVNDKNYEFLGVVLEEEFHLSFPFVFESEGDIFMVPETHEAKEIRLYICEEFPMKWKLETVLMQDLSATDTMIINKDSKWFMLTNICSARCGDHHSELHVFYSDNLRSSDWQSIGNGSPVVFDSLSARNGGLFLRNDVLYRVNQIHGKDHYGKSFGVNEVLDISPQQFSEKRVSTINATFKKGIISTHHFSANDRVAAVDYCRKQRLTAAIKQ